MIRLFMAAILVGIVGGLTGGLARAAEHSAIMPLLAEDVVAVGFVDLREVDVAAIVDQAATELACAAQAVRRRLSATDLPLAFAGGLLTAPNPLSTGLCQRLGLADLPLPLHPPVIGAVLLAREPDMTRQTGEGDTNAHR